MNRLQLQYFSKLYNKWIDFKEIDCKESLEKYEYKIRVNPKVKCKNCVNRLDETIDSIRCDYFNDNDFCSYFKIRKNKL